ncbi:hypothetical protein [Planctobacterium marinum]|uniref:hypothetical protein n=1 Tax=Planctobacterium marinum TaxID=1631968 RepID=UPI001E632C85|nr:hypothetical protein [Planctobacterium marinum]MCC2606153.1 hypothetical protein [Planctobacterium marinum]
MNRQQLMLLLVACLVIIKFVFMPLDEYTESQVSEIEQLSERLSKGKSVIREVNKMQEQEAEIDSRLSDAKAQFEVAQSAEQAQFDFQQRLEEKAKAVDAKIESLEWSGSTTGVPSSSLLKVVFDDDLERVMLLHSDIKNLGFGVVTSDFQLSVQRQILSRKLLGNASGHFTVRIYYLVNDE